MFQAGFEAAVSVFRGSKAAGNLGSTAPGMNNEN
jgi:hypothetical protein